MIIPNNNQIAGGVVNHVLFGVGDMEHAVITTM